MIVTISQPRYLPFAGYLHRIGCSDRFIVLDTVKYTHRDWENRNKVKTAQGPTWLTVPVTARYVTPIPEVRIDNSTDWQRRHWLTLERSYGRAKHFGWLEHRLRPVYEQAHWDDLMTLNDACTTLLASLLDIRTDAVRASDLTHSGTGSDLILNLCLASGADAYLSGPEGRNYLDVGAFRSAGVDVLYQDFVPAPYPQLYGEFVPYLSVVDLLFNCGPDSTAFLRDSQPPPVAAAV